MLKKFEIQKVDFLFFPKDIGDTSVFVLENVYW